MVQVGTGSGNAPIVGAMVGTGGAAVPAQKIMVGTGSAAVEAWSAVPPDPIIDLAPRHYYKMNGNWADEMGVQSLTVNSSRATVGSEYATFKNYQGTRYAEIVGLPAGATGDSYTVTMWIRPATADNYPTLLGRGTGNSNSIDFYWGSTDYYIGTYSQNGPVYPSSFVVGQWQHIAVRVTHTGTSSSTIEIWYNGSSLGSKSMSYGTRHSASDSLKIGSGAAGEYYYRGDIDSLVYFTRALTTAEVQTIYGAGRV